MCLETLWANMLSNRIALGYNRLATLPMAFALLSKLRYLNLKSNSFSVFPDVVCNALWGATLSIR